MNYTEHPKCCMAHHFQDKNSCTCRCHYGLTHEELLAKITPTDWRDGIPQRDAALRAVVELHKPFDGYCQRCTVNNWGELRQEYPCDEIQAIEKELK